MCFRCFTGGDTDPILKVRLNWVNFKIFSEVSVYLQFFSKLSSFTVIPKYCKINNGDCEQFCSIKKSVQKDVLCSCAKGYVLAEDGKRCVSTGMEPCNKQRTVVFSTISVLHDIDLTLRPNDWYFQSLPCVRHVMDYLNLADLEPFARCLSHNYLNRLLLTGEKRLQLYLIYLSTYTP